MKKTALMLAVLILLSALLPGCAGKKRKFEVPDPMPQAVVLGYDYNDLPSFTPVQTGKIPVFKEEDVLFNTHVCSLYLGRDYTHFRNLSPTPGLTMAIVSAFPTPRIVERDDGMLILTFDIDTGYRAFFLIPPEFGYMFVSGTPFIVKDRHSYEEFSHLKIGDEILEVEKIDSVATPFMKWVPLLSSSDKAHLIFNGDGDQFNAPLSTVHYLTDGILKIEYTMLDDDETVVISNIIYSKDRILPDSNGNPIDYTVCEDDLPYNK